MKKFGSVVTAFFLAAAVWAAQEPVRKPDKANAVRAVRFESKPLIDGSLQEAMWQRAATLTGFRQTQPGDNIAPTYETIAMIGYDEKYFYIGIRAFSKPAEIRATMTRRDNILKDDYISVFLDTFNDRRTAYILMLNPFGIQQDGIMADTNDPDYSVDLVWESKGKLTNDGYTVEAAVPFSSFKYEAGPEKFWGVHILRRIQSKDEENSWMPLRREKTGSTKVTNNEIRVGFLSQAGHLTGLTGITQARSLDMIPIISVSETGRRTRRSDVAAGNFAENWRNDPAESSPGATTKVRLTSSISMDAAFNPEFGEVEADQPQITANQRFPLFFEEKRPFFLEGIDLFRTPVQAVHTRTVIDPDLAMKLTGKKGRTNFGLMIASDHAPGNFSDEERSDPELLPGIERFLDENANSGVLRIRQDVGEQSSLGVIATSYNFVEKHNHLAGVDGHLSFTPNTFLDFQMLGTNSQRYFYDPDTDESILRTGNGLGYLAELNTTGKHFSIQTVGEGYSPDYRADLGFTQRVNTNRWSVFTRYNSEPKTDSTFISWSLLFTSLAQFDWDGRMQYAYQYPRLLFNFKHQTFFNVYLYRDYLRIFEEEFGARRNAFQQGSFFGKGERSTVYKGIALEAGTSPSKQYSFRIYFDNAWDQMDYDFGAGPKFPRVSPAALMDPNAPLDPGPGRSLYLNATASYQPADAFRVSLDYTKNNLVRNDTGRVAFDQNLYSLTANYYFSRYTFVRSRIDYDSMIANVRGQFLFGWTPNPGTVFYVGYNDDLNYNGFNPFTADHERGFRRNQRTFFIKMSYLIRRGF